MSGKFFTGLLVVLIANVFLFSADHEKRFRVNISIGITGIPATLNDKQLLSTDPCEAAQAGVDASKLLSQTRFFSTVRNRVQMAGTDRHEHSITFGRDSVGGITTSPMTDGDATNGKVNSNWPGAFADIHNHLNDQPPSAGDVYNLIKINCSRHGYNTRFVVTPVGALYVLYIYDLEFAKDFTAKYPAEQLPGFSPRFPEPVFDDMDRITIYFEAKGVDKLIARENAMAFALNHYNSGLALLKQDGTGNFKKLQTEQKILHGKTMYVVNNCP
jgi:hypothetical protein